MTSRWSGLRPAFAVAALALIVAIPGLWSGFVYDDVPIIVRNPLVHEIGASPRIWTSSYWPLGLLYRPLTIQLFNLEWAVGGGHPAVFHLVSLALAVATALLFWRLARRLLGPAPAFVVAGLFAVHPVHVEAVGYIVGQSELLASLFTLIAVERYLAWRDQGSLKPAQRAALAGFTLLAVFSKETGYVVPLLLLAAEVTVVRPARLPAWRLRDASPPLLLQAGAVTTGILLRLVVLGGTVGEVPAAPFRGLAWSERMLGMLSVVPEWARLLFWPVHLQGEYGPPAIDVAAPFGPGHALGLALLATGLALLLITWNRLPAAALGLAWTALALAPVSNLAAVTGVILAERTLFLPSAGVLLAVGAGLSALLEQKTGDGIRRALLGLSAALIAAGAVRSIERHTVWRSDEIFFGRLVRDAARTARAHRVASVYLLGAGRPREAERAARTALELYRDDPQTYERLSFILRAEKRCTEAVTILSEGVRRLPEETVLRARMIECALAVGDTSLALRSAEEAVALGQKEFERTVQRFRR